MPRFEPFRALRYQPEILASVTAPPYDVLSSTDRDELARLHRDNIVHVDLPLESDGPTRYAQAAKVLTAWRSSHVLELDPQPSLTVYRMRFIDGAGRVRSTSGVMGALEVVDENSGGVLPHERTTPKAKTDRLDLTRATNCNLSPVWGLSLGSGLTAALASPGEPMGHVVVSGVEHIFERISDRDRVAAICGTIAAHDVVIADGHHRYAFSRTFRDELRAAGSPLAAQAELTMTYVAELVEDQLSVAAIHRLYDLSDRDAFDRAIRSHFDVVECPPLSEQITTWMEENGCLILVRPESSPIALRPRESAFDGVRNLDGSRLEHALRNCAHDVRYQHGVGEVAEAVAKGSADAAILIRPVTVEEIRRTASNNELMPPKSTFFTPKLLTGVAIRPLD